MIERRQTIDTWPERQKYEQELRDHLVERSRLRREGRKRPEQALAESIGVSRAALRSLVARGLVVATDPESVARAQEALHAYRMRYPGPVDSGTAICVITGMTEEASA